MGHEPVKGNRDDVSGTASQHDVVDAALAIIDASGAAWNETRPERYEHLSAAE